MAKRVKKIFRFHPVMICPPDEIDLSVFARGGRMAAKDSERMARWLRKGRERKARRKLAEQSKRAAAAGPRKLNAPDSRTTGIADRVLNAMAGKGWMSLRQVREAAGLNKQQADSAVYQRLQPRGLIEQAESADFDEARELDGFSQTRNLFRLTETGAALAKLGWDVLRRPNDQKGRYRPLKTDLSDLTARQ